MEAMKPNIKTTEAFYHNLGKLFYSIAAADKKVHEEEFKTLRSFIEKYWLDYDDLEDIFESDAAYLIEVVFEGVDFFQETPANMYDDFLIYKQEQPQLFTKEVNQLILETARAIAHSFSGVNKSELIILHQLEMELNRL